MLLLYWQLGYYILANQNANGWGARIIDLLAADLKKEFPALKGFSSRNLKYMRKFTESYNETNLIAFIDIEKQIRGNDAINQSLIVSLLQANDNQFLIVQQPVAQLEKTGTSIVQQPVAQSKKTHAPIAQQPVAQLKKGAKVQLEKVQQPVPSRIISQIPPRGW